MLFDIAFGDAGEAGGNAASIQILWRLNAAVLGHAHGQATLADPEGENLVFATYISGSGLDRFFGVAIDADRNVYAIGDSDSTDYPLQSALQGTAGGNGDLVVTKLSADGASLIYSTYVGGNNMDRSCAENDKPSIAVDSSQRAYITVVTQSTDFDTAYSCTLADPGPFVLRINASGSAVDYCYGIGGDENVFLHDIAVDTSNRATVVGFTADDNVATTAGTLQPARNDGEDIFVVRVNAAGTATDRGTYIGGTLDDFGNSVSLDLSGNTYVAGRSDSTDYPITIGGQPNGLGVVTKLDAALTTVVYSRALGMSDAVALDVDGVGRVSVVGNDFGDAVFTHLAANGSQEFETFWGGILPDFANGVAVDAAGHAFVTGETRSSGFPGDTVQNPSPFQGSISGNIDAWVVKLLRDDPIPQVPALPGGMAVAAAALLAAGIAAARRATRRTRGAP